MTEQGERFQTQDKLALLLTLVPYLVEKGRVSVSAASAHFGVEPRRIRDAIRLIALSGVPGETNAYLPNDLFDISWDDLDTHDEIVLTHHVAIDDSPRFSSREAAALIAGLNYVSALHDDPNDDLTGSLMIKLSRGSRESPPSLAVSQTAQAGCMTDLRRALTDRVRVEFDYRSARGVDEHRIVDPLRLESLDNDWYLRGWDHRREGVRTFRVDRMRDLRVTAEARDIHPGEVAVPERLFEPSDGDLIVTVDVVPSAFSFIEEYVQPDAMREEHDGLVRTTIRVAHFHGLKRLVAGLSGFLTVIAPDEARKTVAEWARSALDQYSEADRGEVVTNL